MLLPVDVCLPILAWSPLALEEPPGSGAVLLTGGPKDAAVWVQPCVLGIFVPEQSLWISLHVGDYFIICVL